MSVDYEYDFTEGLYRAKVKTKYRRADMSMSDWIYSNPFEFEKIDFVDTGLGWGAKKRYLIYDQRTVFDRVHQPNWYTRDFYKYSDGWALAVNANPSYTGYCGPIMISSKLPDGNNYACYYQNQWGYDEVHASIEFEYLGIIWVMTPFASWMAGNNNPNELEGGVPDFDITRYNQDQILIGKAILDTAGVKEVR